MRSRCACTTSTGDTSFALISRASSTIDAKTRSLMARRSENAVLGGRLDLERHGPERVHQGSTGPDEREEPRQLVVREIEALRFGEHAERGERERFHGRRIAARCWNGKRR